MGITQFNKIANSGRWHTAEWPESPDKTDSVFDRRASLRILRVMIDADLLDESSNVDMKGTPTKGILLKSLLLLSLELINPQPLVKFLLVLRL